MDSKSNINPWIIMQARVRSTRLPAKILKKILGRTVLEHDIERCLRIKRAKGLVIATTVKPEDREIIRISELYPSNLVKYFRGSVEDVLSRYYLSAKQVKADIIIRITSDCPLLDASLVDAMIMLFENLPRKKPSYDYVCNIMPRTFPHGLDTEIFSFEALEKAFKEATLAEEREHVTPYIRNHPEIFHINNFSQEENQSHLRWTLDYPEDFEFIKAVYDRLYPHNPEFNRFDVLSLLEKHPEINSLNQSRRQG